MRTFVVAILLLAVMPSWGLAQEKKRPNVLFLFVDDLRADALGAFGHPVLKTPNLDRLVKNGFFFRNAYCFGSNSPAVCTPSRNMLLSGRVFFRWKGLQAPADGPNWPATMRQAGYETYHHGKSGNVAALIQRSFEHNHSLKDQQERTSGQPGRTVVDGAVEFLKKRKGDKPFFLYLAFEAPHDPRVAANEYRKLYDPGKIPLPKNYRPQHPFDNGEMSVRDETLAPWPRSESDIRSHLHDYYAVISGLDHHIGRLLALLDELKLRDDTIILFSSDHGLAVGSHGLMGKQSLYDDGMRVPLVFAGPGVQQGKSSDALVYLHDLFPTVCEMVGAKQPANLDGISQAKTITGGTQVGRESLFLAYRDVQRAVRDSRWKLIRYPKINRTQLFDLKEDPHEMKDLSGDPQREKRIQTLMATMREWQKKVGDPAPLEVANPAKGDWVPPLAKKKKKE